MKTLQKHIILLLTIFLWLCISVRANEVSVLHLLKDLYANGNPISVEDTTANTLRVMQWDEENRLQSLGDDGYVSRYTYNHAGERVIKSHGPTTVAFVNGAPQGILWHDKDNWTMYVSPYMVVNADRFTKHYYAGSQRIASKIGAGEFDNLYDASKACVTAGQKDYAERLNLITQSRNDYYAALGIPPGPPTAKGIYGEAEYSGAYGDYSLEPLGNYDVPTGWPMKPYKRPYGGTPGAPVMYEKPSDPEDEGAGYGYTNAENIQENDIYFYHSDHLGSTSYITDANGEATQFVCYKPYGEALVDEHATSFESPWKFNGKELDSETGLYYYGARYYEASLTAWYGPDKLAEDYPSIGSYVYCAANPISITDPDGNDIKIFGENESCITLTTDLIDFEVNASSLGIDWGGQYTLDGEDVLSAGLDIVGIFDPSGIADGVNAALQAKNGDYLDATISVAGLIPYVGDVAKVGKVGKDVKIISNAIDAVKAEKKCLSNADLVQKAANKAEKAIGGVGHVPGTKKHTYAESLINRYQKMYGDRGLNVNEYFRDKGFGKGFLDVHDTQNGIIYDFKFGKAQMSNKQYNKYHNTFPNDQIIIVKPK